MIVIDPATRQRFSVDPFCSDFEYIMKGDPAIVNEEVPITDEWSDYTGSGKVDRGRMMNAGAVNIFQGTDAELAGAKLGNLTETGEHADTHRSRPIKKHVEIQKP